MVTAENPWDDDTRITKCKNVEFYLKSKQSLIDGSIEDIQEKCTFFLPIFEGCL